MAFQQLTEEPLRRTAITSGLHEDVDHVTILVNRPPEIPTPALNLHKQLVEIPGVAQAPSPVLSEYRAAANLESPHVRL